MRPTFKIVATVSMMGEPREMLIAAGYVSREKAEAARAKLRRSDTKVLPE